MLRRLLLTLLLLALAAPAWQPVPAAAQGDESCPALVRQALTTLDENCADTGRNEACYGHVLLQAEFWQAVEAGVFARPADRVAAAEIHSLSGSPLDPAKQVWGLGMLRLQADIPDTLPGQAVTFLLVGDVQVESAVPPEAMRQPVTPVAITATAGVNLRGGPGTNFSVVGSVPPGTTLPAIGRNAAGDWTQVALEDGQRAWISTQFVRAEGELAALPVLTGAPSYGPLQAFYFRTGPGSIECRQAPPDHILVNSPEGLAVSFNANGVRFTLGSTAALRRPEDTMTITTFEGQAVVEVTLPEGGTFALTIPPGLEADVPLGVDDQGRPFPVGAPQNFRPLDPEEWVGYEGVSEGMEVVGGFSVPEPPPLPSTEQITEAVSGGEATSPTGVQLGTGDVQVTLVWDNLADMDLAVIEPNGTEIYFGNRQSATGGRLDLDSNFPCGSNTNFAENIFWPTGQAPRGTYRVLVNQFSTCGAGDARWTLVVRVDGQVVLQEQGVGGAAQFQFTR